jgi:Crp-like helix-turn-helix domain
MPRPIANGLRISGHAQPCRDWHISFASLPPRLEMVGLLDGDSFRLPFTQQDFADACGLSTVPVNRTIQELRRRDLIEWQGPMVRLLQREELEMIADFSPGYLHALDTSAAGRAQRT